MVAPEKIHADTVRHVKFFTIGYFKFRQCRIERNRDIRSGAITTLFDGLLHHCPQAQFRQLIFAPVHIGGQSSFEANTHHPAAFRLFEDLLEAILQAHRHLLRFLCVHGAQNQEHGFLHADV